MCLRKRVNDTLIYIDKILASYLKYITHCWKSVTVLH